MKVWNFASIIPRIFDVKTVGHVNGGVMPRSRRWHLNVTDWWRTKGDSWTGESGRMRLSRQTRYHATTDFRWNKHSNAQSNEIKLTCPLKYVYGQIVCIRRLRSCGCLIRVCVSRGASPVAAASLFVGLGKAEVFPRQGISGQECSGILPLSRNAKQKNDTRRKSVEFLCDVRRCGQRPKNPSHYWSVRSDLML